MEDCQIVALYWQRNADAITETNAKYGKYCYAIAYNILANSQDAEECVNDTWLGAWNAMPEHRPERLAAFVGKITRSLACNRRKAKHTQKRGGGELPLVLDELAACLPGAASAEQAAEDAELAQAINRFLRTLPAQDCDIFLRRYWYAEPLAVIARGYGLKLNTIKSSLFRSRGRLKRFLEQEGICI